MEQNTRVVEASFPEIVEMFGMGSLSNKKDQVYEVKTLSNAEKMERSRAKKKASQTPEEKEKNKAWEKVRKA